MTVLKRLDTADSSVFVSVLETLGDYLGDLSDQERATWTQAVYYLHLLVFYRRSVEERADLERLVSEHREDLNLSQEEATLMQTMAEHYLQQGIEQGKAQGIEQGARQTSIESTLATLNARFPQADVNALKPTLEAIEDLNRLKHLNLMASLVDTLDAFGEHLKI